MAVSYEISKADAASRDAAIERVRARNPHLDVEGAKAALTACHANGCPLDFGKLEASEDWDLNNDVYGIINHLNPKTGKLEGGIERAYGPAFTPKCAR